jgi:uncharacterized surface protein with fasciclin (FAS1) repeats
MPKVFIVIACLAMSAGVASAQTPVAPVAVPAAPVAAPVTPSGDVIDTLKAAGQFTTLLKAADLVGLTAFVKSRPDITLLAPTDAAFALLPPGEADRLFAEANRADLQKLVLRHLINARVPLADFKGAVRSAPTMGGQAVELNGDEPASVSGAPIVQADVAASNGWVHVLGKVIPPPGS